jgi:hypothetical protein
MIKYLFSLIIFLKMTADCLGQKNEHFLSSEKTKINQLIDKGVFVQGYIYMGSDTIKTDLLLFDGKNKKYNYLICVCKFGHDSIVILKPTEIKGYKIGLKLFASHQVKQEHFFIKHLKSGKVHLFEKESTPNDPRELYYLRFPIGKDYFVIDPNQSSIEMQEIANINQASDLSRAVYFQSTGLNDKFKLFISKHMGDCSLVCNMVKSEFYSVRNLPDIVEEYNKCNP